MTTKPALRFGVITLFPDMVNQYFTDGVISRAVSNGLVDMMTFNPRNHTHDRHQSVDDRPFGGGPGMVMSYIPLEKTILEAKKALGNEAKVVYLSPQGQRLSQSKVQSLLDNKVLVLLCGRYEGVDQRLIDRYVDEEISIGDYVLSGGELPAMVMMDAMIRLVPGVLNDQQSAVEDSFYSGLLDCPHYTRPAELPNGDRVPDVLLSGDHKKIAEWRYRQQLIRTYERREDMIACLCLSQNDKKILAQAGVLDRECTTGEKNEK